MSSNAAISTYRSLNRLIRRIQKPNDRTDAMKQLNDEYRSNRKVGAAEVEALLLGAKKKMEYLRMITPKDRSRDGPQTGSQRYVYAKDGPNKTGKVVRARYSNWHGGNLDPESVKRHHQLLNRGGWRDNAHAKGVF
mmetsp:Transcript_24871/g.49485  ORF Transcript_24871/g.49485 Transcript_24871/m.49485 type:complete len:136 (+) Transcript_24871:62-469(+)